MLADNLPDTLKVLSVLHIPIQFSLVLKLFLFIIVQPQTIYFKSIKVLVTLCKVTVTVMWPVFL